MGTVRLGDGTTVMRRADTGEAGDEANLFGGGTIVMTSIDDKKKKEEQQPVSDAPAWMTAGYEAKTDVSSYAQSEDKGASLCGHVHCLAFSGFGPFFGRVIFVFLLASLINCHVCAVPSVGVATPQPATEQKSSSPRGEEKKGQGSRTPFGLHFCADPVCPHAIRLAILR